MKYKTLHALILLLPLTACGDKSTGEPAVETRAPEPAATMPKRTASADAASVFFVSPTNGATVSNPVKVVFGIEGMVVVPAGQDTPQSGHHHLLIDTDLPDLGLPIPKDETHIHFGDGSTATEITLPPGEHRLQMLLGDHLHIPHDPPLMSDVITINVK